nr:MAG TPA: Protein of unknown function (DUF1642) [Caudoviricetes sp.]
MNKQEALKQIEEQRDMILELHGWGVFGYIKGIINQLDEPLKIELPKVEFKKSPEVKVPQFVADVIEGAKEQSVELEDAFEYVWEVATGELREWFRKLENRNNFARAWLDGYEVEEEKKYKIKLLNRNDGDLYLVNQNANLADKYGHFSPVVLLFTKSTNFSEQCYKLTKKDVVANDFGWVFDCEGIEIEEVDLCH